MAKYRQSISGVSSFMIYISNSRVSAKYRGLKKSNLGMGFQ
jgi:hypothetical protein